jgi:PiT family inorganic phosphate transporter
MDPLFLVFLSSGLFLGWSLGASDASNIFGTAVATNMVKFRTAAIISSIFIILGAVYAGSGASETLGELGSLDTLPGAFMAALAAALSVYWAVKYGLPVSTSQAVVGAIIGWNLYANKETDIGVLTKIVSTWITCPILSGVIAIIIFYITKTVIKKSRMHLIRQDYYTRIGLILTGAFGAYALGANNIANVMGVFVPSNPFSDINYHGFSLNSTQVLFLLGSIAISVGVFTYSRKVMSTIGTGIMSMTPTVAWVVVFSHSIVLLLFASKGLQMFLEGHGLPSLPLVPVSSTQAVIGAVIGIGIAKGGRGIRWSILVKIAIGWVATPVISAMVCFISLFFLENVFNQVVYLR